MAVSNGVYSVLRDKWLKRPEKSVIPDVDQTEVDEIANEYRDRAKSCSTIEDIDELIDDLYVLRQESILNEGEYGIGNLAFKELRSEGLLDELRDKKVSLENKDMSLESLNEEDDTSFDDFLRDAEIILVDDARTFDINKWELESDSEIEEMMPKFDEDYSHRQYIKYKLDNDKIDKIISKLRVEDISIADYWKTKQFLKSHNFAKEDLYNVLRNLHREDYVTNSKEVNDRDNEACIFIKNSKVKDLGPFKLYIKIDYDSVANTPVVVVSIHE